MPTLQFKGKALVQNHHLVVPFSELEPVKARGVSESPSLHDNLIVEGDNLKSLKALLPAFHGKVKCIYIDPPYNTGNEGWIYNDKVNSPMIRDWLGKAVDRDDLTRHDKWCCMMLPRLKLLRELLSDDGAIFVSIDDNEVHHLRALMDEVFGEENFVAQIVWEKGRKNDAKLVSSGHDYFILYVRSIERLRELKTVWREAKPGAAEIQQEYIKLKALHGTNFGEIERGLETFYNALPRTHPSKKHSRYGRVDSRGVWRDDNMSWPGGGGPDYDVIHPVTGKACKVPEGGWRYATPQKMQEMIDAGVVEFREDDTQPPIRKTYLVRSSGEDDDADDPDDIGIQVAGSYFYRSALQASRVLYGIFGSKKFESPKDHEVLKRWIRYITGNDKEFIVLDSFAGSGTTAHAVLALNKEDGGNRRFILCQMPYETKEQEKEKENICDTITAERVRRVIKGVPNAKDEDLRAGLGGTFSYFKLGKELQKQAILDGTDLPSYEALAGYVFFTATGEEFQPAKMKRKEWFIGTSRERDVFLIYEQDFEKLKDIALNLDLARAIAKYSNRPKLVFAPTKYLDQDYLDHLRIEFCQLPFEIYQHASK